MVDQNTAAVFLKPSSDFLSKTTDLFSGIRKPCLANAQNKSLTASMKARFDFFSQILSVSHSSIYTEVPVIKPSDIPNVGEASR